MRLIVFVGAVLGLAVGLTFAQDAPVAVEHVQAVEDAEPAEVEVALDTEGRFDVAKFLQDLFGESSWLVWMVKRAWYCNFRESICVPFLNNALKFYQSGLLALNLSPLRLLWLLCQIAVVSFYDILRLMAYHKFVQYRSHFGV